MKPRISYADLQWQQAFARLKDLPQGTKLKAGEREFVLDHVWDDPHPPSLELKYREDKKLKKYTVRRGDPLMLELRAGSCG